MYRKASRFMTTKRDQSFVSGGGTRSCNRHNSRSQAVRVRASNATRPASAGCQALGVRCCITKSYHL